MAATLGGFAFIAACWFLGPAMASSLSAGSGSIGAGGSEVTRCDPDGVSTVFVLSGSNVVSVTISGISAACAGQPIKASLTNGTTTGAGSGTVPAGGGSMSVTVSPQPPVTNPNVLQTEIVVG